MKKKILISMLILIIALTVQVVFSTTSKASTDYNTEICYDEGKNGITVKPVGKYIQNATIPNYINGKKVIKVSDFSDCKDLKTVTLPDTLEEINGYAFENCDKLTTIKLPNSLKTIGNGAFSGCTGLKSLTELSEKMFEQCIGLKSITIPNNVTFIDKAAFKGCTGLTSITIPSSVTGLGDYGYMPWGTFEGCTNLKTANIQANVTKLPGGMFARMYCTYKCNFTINIDFNIY